MTFTSAKKVWMWAAAGVLGAAIPAAALSKPASAAAAAPVRAHRAAHALAASGAGHAPARLVSHKHRVRHHAHGGAAHQKAPVARHALKYKVAGGTHAKHAPRHKKHATHKAAGR